MAEELRSDKVKTKKYTEMRVLTQALLERPAFASHVPLFSFEHFQTSECEVSGFCL